MANGIPKRSLVREIKKYHTKFTHQDVIKAWERSSASGLQIIVVDREYKAVPDWLWGRVLKYSGIDSKMYVAEFRDCDDFSFALRGTLPIRLGLNGVGCVVDTSSSHAYSAILVVGKDGLLHVQFVEPQTDKRVVVDTPLYRMDHGFAIF